MQTILGANGQIAVELARALEKQQVDRLRLVSRNPRPVDGSEELVPADLLDAEQTRKAVAGSDVVYFTAGLPARTRLWEERFPTMLAHALDAARAAGAGFAYFDNTYMYPQDARVQTEETPFEPVGPKGRVRAAMARTVLAEMERREIPVLIARAPEFYGPGRTQGFTNSLVMDRLKDGKRPLVPVSARTRRSLIWTPDASRGLAALGNAPDAYGQTWHLPVSEEHPTYKQLLQMAEAPFSSDGKYTVVPRRAFRAAGLVSESARELRELLPRYAQDNVFDSSKFRKRFPDLAVTSYAEGLRIIAEEAGA